MANSAPSLMGASLTILFILDINVKIRHNCQQEVRHMKTMSLLLVAIVITGCSEAAKPPRDAAMEAATARMSIASGDNVPGNPQYVTLGKVRAHCMENPQASYITATDIIADGDDLQQAAYRKYGSQVDAIVDANIFHVSNYKQRYPLFYDEGHFECEGTAVHFRESKQHE